MTFAHHRHAAHCESGVVSNLISHHGMSISEAMAFGLSAALSFAYLPFIKLSGLPLIAYRQPPGAIIRGLAKSLSAEFRFETFRTPASGQARLDELLEQGHVVGLQTSVYWLPYFPEDMRFHFNAHNLLVYGKEGDEYLISDPVAEQTVRCNADALSRARFTKGLLAPKGLLYTVTRPGLSIITPQAARKAILKTCRTMHAPLPIIGVRGIRMLANKVAKLDPAARASSLFVGHIIRMQEEIGTGGAGFRFLYAAFLQEAAGLSGMTVLNGFSERLMAIGDGWREFALATARMVKGRDAMNPTKLADLLHNLSRQEEVFFRDLKVSVT
ncbi:MAG: BtrH N-terminal domain-containing protein [Gallionella sp.]